MPVHMDQDIVSAVMADHLSSAVAGYLFGRLVPVDNGAVQVSEIDTVADVLQYCLVIEFHARYTLSGRLGIQFQHTVNTMYHTGMASACPDWIEPLREIIAKRKIFICFAFGLSNIALIRIRYREQ